jgi:choline-glycine betaine transporter
MGGSEPVDFNEEQVKKMLARSPYNQKLRTWVSFGNTCIGAKLNWMTFLLATAVTWGFAGVALGDADAGTYFADGKSWVSQNFTWLYIITQDVWCAFLIYLLFSRYGNLKLGKDDEKPRYNDFTWFCMLFTCGVAVGLYVFGAAEPLYFYRQPSVWHSWAYDYAHHKTGVENDAMRAQQSIFMAVYHWGIHGWVPYILLALLAGVVSFRWNMPMTIRSCFYPLIGDHALGFAGDIIDALSIATTTFGVCTSLGLGVTQLASGLAHVKNVRCFVKDNCIAAGGKWNLNTYGVNTCEGHPEVMNSCDAPWLATPESTTTTYFVIIILITFIATCSVLTGLDRGIKTLAQMAFTCGMIVMLTIIFADNTWYILNVMVQTTGYYMQHVIQVGFDCEAFQQLAFEFRGGGANKFWGTEGGTSALGEITAAGLSPTMSSADCGDQVNPCQKGYITASFAAALASTYAPQAANAAAQLMGPMRMSKHSTDNLKKRYEDLNRAYNGVANVPCGSGWSTTELDDFLVHALDNHWVSQTKGQALCNSNIVHNANSCASAWAGEFPRCPETLFKEASQWGSCEEYLMSCPITATVYDDTNPMFMDWWTIFYWAWWITWAPFVGFFVALISRGRTVRNVIIGGFVCPTLFAIMWFSVFGGLAIKMQRVVEIGLGLRVDIQHAAVTCAEHYSGVNPITPPAKRLADQGYYMLACLPKDEQIYYMMKPYTNLTGFIHIFLWVGLVIYFLTSSDSGSMTDDIISASGLSAPLIPSWQKVFWCCTEGLVAIALTQQNSNKALQALSIIIALPYTGFLCMMVPALLRVLKKEAGDEDINKSFRFNTQILDFLVFYQPHGGSPVAPSTHFKEWALALFVPFLHLKAVYAKVYPNSSIASIVYGLMAQVLYTLWIVFHILEVGRGGLTGFHTIGWLCFIGFVALTTFMRLEARRIYNVYGSAIDDIFVALFAYPWALAQIKMAVDTDNKDAPTYFASADELIADMAAAADKTPGVSSNDVESSKVV